MRAYEHVELSIEDPVGLIRLNRPEKLNAVTYGMLAEIRDAVDRCAADPAVVGIVVTGTGRGFCAGLDSQALMEVTASGGANRGSSREGDVPGMFSYLQFVPKPVIAAVNGVAAGGGLSLAGMADIRIASTQASFTTVFLKRGLIAEHGSSWYLPHLLGPGRALDLLWTSEKIDAKRALEIGLVEYVVAHESLLDEAKGYVRRIAASSSPASIADTKKLVYEQLAMKFRDSMVATEPVQWAAVARADAREGAQALIERREPVFARLGAAPAEAVAAPS